MNRTNSPSLLLFVGAELYATFAVLAWSRILGNVMCHNESPFSLLSSRIMHPLCLIVIRSAVNVAEHPALHKSDIESNESESSLSSKMCAKIAWLRLGK